MKQALTSPQSNIGRKQLVDANFRAFAQFAEALHRHQIQQIDCEWCSHPELMEIYDQDLRGETRERLRQMSNKIGFSYFDETQMPTFNSSDFADPYHLGKPGRKRLSLWLAAILTQGVNHKSSQQIRAGENPSDLCSSSTDFSSGKH
ncbi:MAG: hypothetical protein JSS49_30820 [Planctomycetes bacterium]|nr:hypothetical protein [Planctomycetota bacterium]